MAYDPTIVARMQTTRVVECTRRVRTSIFESAVTWDRDLLREPRVLVPIDAQAYVVASAGRGRIDAAVPVAANAGRAGEYRRRAGAAALRPGIAARGWRASALGAARFAAPRQLSRSAARRAKRVRHRRRPTTRGGGLDLPALPDRWAVLRLVAATNATQSRCSRLGTRRRRMRRRGSFRRIRRVRRFHRGQVKLRRPRSHARA